MTLYDLCGAPADGGPCTRMKGHLSERHWHVGDEPPSNRELFRAEKAGYESALREVDQEVLVAHRAADQHLEFTRGWNAALSHVEMAIARKLEDERR